MTNVDENCRKDLDEFKNPLLTGVDKERKAKSLLEKYFVDSKYKRPHILLLIECLIALKRYDTRKDYKMFKGINLDLKLFETGFSSKNKDKVIEVITILVKNNGKKITQYETATKPLYTTLKEEYEILKSATPTQIKDIRNEWANTIIMPTITNEVLKISEKLTEQKKAFEEADMRQTISEEYGIDGKIINLERYVNLTSDPHQMIDEYREEKEKILRDAKGISLMTYVKLTYVKSDSTKLKDEDLKAVESSNFNMIVKVNNKTIEKALSDGDIKLKREYADDEIKRISIEAGKIYENKQSNILRENYGFLAQE
jgi:hypothetical protein